jgi:HAMP domain-containing protein
MSDQPNQTRPFFKRAQYIVDFRAQSKLVLPIVLVPVIVALAYVAAVYLLPGQTAIETMSAQETRSMFLRVNILYFTLAMVCLVATALVFTHRVIGPAQVIERAVRGIQAGDYDQRLSLRPGDGLLTLAVAVGELREELREREERQRSLGREIAALLDANDLDAARELAARLEKTEDRS